MRVTPGLARDRSTQINGEDRRLGFPEGDVRHRARDQYLGP